jgi:cysteine desulfurase family protein (TIGR01976 family)
MPSAVLDVEAVRARFRALRSRTLFLDAPGGTQVPEPVVEAMARYLSECCANLGGHFATSRASDLLVEQAHIAAAAFLGARPDEVGFGANMTTLNFALTRALGRELEPGDEIVVTRLDHDGNVAPWLELARDLDLVVRRLDVRDDTTLDLDQLEMLLGPRTRVVAFPWASNAVGTVTPVDRVADLAHAAGALAWVDAVHYAPHGPIDVALTDVDVLLCSPYKFFGPHLGLFYARRELLERWRPYKVRPAPDRPASARYETGTLAHEALAGFVACVEYLRELGWPAIQSHEQTLAARFLDGLPDPYSLHGPASTDGRVPTFALTLPGRRPSELAAALADRDIAAWSGNYYAVEIMERLGLPDGALRIGFVHYNAEGEVDTVLDELARLAA